MSCPGVTRPTKSSFSLSQEGNGFMCYLTFMKHFVVEHTYGAHAPLTTKLSGPTSFARSINLYCVLVSGQWSNGHQNQTGPWSVLLDSAGNASTQGAPACETRKLKILFHNKQTQPTETRGPWLMAWPLVCVCGQQCCLLFTAAHF